MAAWTQAAGIAGFAIVYPFLSPYVVSQGWGNLELLVFAALTARRGWTADKPGWRLGYFGLAALLLAGAFSAQAYMVWLLPSFVYLSLAVVFGHTLWQPPSLCERLVRLQYPEFQPGIAEYLRQLTWVWTAFFAVNVPLCALLPALAGGKVWAAYTGVGVYLLMGLLGVGEYLYRPRRFPGLGMPSPKETFQFMARHGHKVFKGVEP